MNVHGMWKAVVGVKEGKSCLLQSFHQWPLHICKPFGGKNGELVVYLQDASPGLFNGDVQELSCVLEKDAKLYLTNTAASRLHPSAGFQASRQVQRFILREGAVLEFFPEPLVPFKDACFAGETYVHMERGAQAIISEIITPGRIGRGELFQYRRLGSKFSVYWDDRLTVWDSLVLEPSTWDQAEEMRSGVGYFGGYTHMGTVWILSERATTVHIDQIYQLMDAFPEQERGSDVYEGASLLTANGLVIRMLGHSVHALQERIDAIWRHFKTEMLGEVPWVIRK